MNKKTLLTRQISNQVRLTPLCTAWGTAFLVATNTTNCFATQDKQQSPRFKLGHSCKTLKLTLVPKGFWNLPRTLTTANLVQVNRRQVWY